jgi:hypothetical protein
MSKHLSLAEQQAELAIRVYEKLINKLYEPKPDPLSLIYPTPDTHDDPLKLGLPRNKLALDDIPKLGLPWKKSVVEPVRRLTKDKYQTLIKEMLSDTFYPDETGNILDCLTALFWYYVDLSRGIDAVSPKLSRRIDFSYTLVVWKASLDIESNEKFFTGEYESAKEFCKRKRKDERLLKSKEVLQTAPRRAYLEKLTESAIGKSIRNKATRIHNSWTKNYAEGKTNLKPYKESYIRKILMQKNS